MAYRDMQYDRKTAKVARYYDRTKDGKLGVPISLQVALCDACFNRCIMCDHPQRDPQRMNAKDWVSSLRWFASKGVESVCYSGGDPMAYSDFNGVMEAHIALDLPFGMTITGYVPPTIDLERMAHAKWVRVSLDAITPEVYEKCRGKVPVDKVTASIKRMLAAKVPVGLGITVHADNEADLPNVLEFAKRVGITDIETHHIVPDSPDRATKVIGWHRQIEPFQHCHASLYQLYIDASGDVYACCITAGDSHARPQAAALGNIWKQSWDHEIWPAVVQFSKVQYKYLHHICHTTCIQRLSQINSVCDDIGETLSNKSFF